MSILVEINPLEEVLKTINIPNKTGLLWDQIEYMVCMMNKKINM